MKIEVSFIYPGQEEGDCAGEFHISEEKIDWSSLTVDEIKKIRDKTDKFKLPNGEVLDIKGGCYETNFTINIRQEGKLLAQLISNGSGNLVFPTLSGGTVSFEMYFKDEEEIA